MRGAAAGLGAAVEGLGGYEGYAFDTEPRDGGNGFEEMPDFKPLATSDATSEELTAELLEPEAALEAEEDIPQAAADDLELELPDEGLTFEPEADKSENEGKKP